MNKLVVASHNPKKLQELQAILAQVGYQTIGASEVHLPDVEETEDTFVGNATLKVESAFRHLNFPALADDSGFCVDALNGAPGVYSARYEGGYQRVLKEIAHLTKPKDRRAHFVCIIAYIDENGEQHNFKGRISGHIPMEPQGTAGFAYDPIFIPDGFDITFAEMTAEQKHSLSHRGQALAKLVEHLRQKTK